MRLSGIKRLPFKHAIFSSDQIQWSSDKALGTIDQLEIEGFNPLKGSGIGWLHFKVFSAIQV